MLTTICISSVVTTKMLFRASPPKIMRTYVPSKVMTCGRFNSIRKWYMTKLPLLVAPVDTRVQSLWNQCSDKKDSNCQVTNRYKVSTKLYYEFRLCSISHIFHQNMSYFEGEIFDQFSFVCILIKYGKTIRMALSSRWWSPTIMINALSLI